MTGFFEKSRVKFAAIVTGAIYVGGVFFIPSFKEMSGTNAIIVGYMFLVTLFILGQVKHK